MRFNCVAAEVTRRKLADPPPYVGGYGQDLPRRYVILLPEICGPIVFCQRSRPHPMHHQLALLGDLTESGCLCAAVTIEGACPDFLCLLRCKGECPLVDAFQLRSIPVSGHQAGA